MAEKKSLVCMMLTYRFEKYFKFPKFFKSSKFYVLQLILVLFFEKQSLYYNIYTSYDIKIKKNTQLFNHNTSQNNDLYRNQLLKFILLNKNTVLFAGFTFDHFFQPRPKKRKTATPQKKNPPPQNTPSSSKKMKVVGGVIHIDDQIIVTSLLITSL